MMVSYLPTNLKLTLYNYAYIRPDSGSECLYHADQGRILNFTSLIRNGYVPEGILLDTTVGKVVKNPASLRKI